MKLTFILGVELLMRQILSRLKKTQEGQGVKYIKLFRPKTVLIYLFPLILALCAGMGDLKSGKAVPVSNQVYRSVNLGLSILFALIAFFCGSMFSSTLNFYSDVEADRIHDGLYKDQDISRQPFVTGELGRKDAYIILFVTGAGCVLFSFLVNYRFALFMIGSVVLLGVIYSHPLIRFKGRPILDVLTNSFGAVLLLIAGMSIVSSNFPPILPMIFGFFLAALLYIPSVVNDVFFDARAGFRTSAVVFGQKRMLFAMAMLNFVLLPLGTLITFTKEISWEYRLFDSVATAASIIATLFILIRYRPPHIEINPMYMVVPLAAMLAFYFGLVVYRLVKE